MGGKIRLTDSRVERLRACPASSAAHGEEYSDTDVPGFKLTVGKSGSKTFSFRCKHEGRSYHLSIGTFPGIKTGEARQRAIELRAMIERGENPREASDRRRAVPTFADFVQERYLPWARVAKRSVANDESKLRHHLLPAFGRRRLDEITRRDVEMHHLEIKQSHAVSTANRHLTLLSAIFRQAVVWEIVDRNPCMGIKQFPENNARTRYLSLDEIARLFKAMEAERNKVAVAALRFLLLTGVRREEALRARWEDVNLEAGSLRLTRTKNGRPRMVALNQVAVALLAEQPSRSSSVWVFPGRGGQAPLVNPRKVFERVLKAAGIEEHTRIHDLRHTFASVAVNAGVSLYTVQQLLGHATPQMTQRYAHLQDSTVRKASQAVADAVSAAMGGGG